MNKKITITFCCCALLFIVLFPGCQKKNNIKPNVKNIALVVLDPYFLDTNGTTHKTAGTVYNYRLRGSILSPSKIDMTDHGFFVIDSTTNSNILVRMGSGIKEGYIEKDYSSSTQIIQSDLIMYAILKTGDTIYSLKKTSANPFYTVTSGGSITTPVTPPAIDFNMFITIVNPNLSNKGSSENFTGNIYNLDTSRFIIQQYGIDFDTINGFNGTYKNQYIDPTSQYLYTGANPPYLISGLIGVPIATNFVVGKAYYCRVFAIAKDKTNSSTGRVNSTPITFAP